ncbi:MAG: tetratricopeptide repeat protein [Bdellovibrionales bacterium]
MRYLLNLSLVLAAHMSLAFGPPTHITDLEKLHESGKDLYKNRNATYESFKKVFEKENLTKYYQSKKSSAVDAVLLNEQKALAQKGNPEAQVRLGLSLYHRVQKQDSLYWIQKAADQNYAEAQFYLASLFYKDGVRVKKDNNKAMNLMLKAANQGMANAQFVFGSWLDDLLENYSNYQDQNPVEWKTPSYWMEKAAKQDHTAAQAVLAYNYLHGIYGVEQDNIQAYAWAFRALINDSSYNGERFWEFVQNKQLARQVLAQSKKQMNAEELTKAKNMDSTLRKHAKNVHNPRITKDIVAGSVIAFVTWKLGGKVFGRKIPKHLKKDYNARLNANKRNFRSTSKQNWRNLKGALRSNKKSPGKTRAEKRAARKKLVNEHNSTVKKTRSDLNAQNRAARTQRNSDAKKFNAGLKGKTRAEKRAARKAAKKAWTNPTKKPARKPTNKPVEKADTKKPENTGKDILDKLETAADVVTDVVK